MAGPWPGHGRAMAGPWPSYGQAMAGPWPGQPGGITDFWGGITHFWGRNHALLGWGHALLGWGHALLGWLVGSPPVVLKFHRFHGKRGGWWRHTGGPPSNIEASPSPSSRAPPKAGTLRNRTSKPGLDTSFCHRPLRSLLPEGGRCRFGPVRSVKAHPQEPCRGQLLGPYAGPQ